MSIAISALAPDSDEDRGTHDIDIYAQLHEEAVTHIIKSSDHCV